MSRVRPGIDVVSKNTGNPHATTAHKNCSREDFGPNAELHFRAGSEPSLLIAITMPIGDRTRSMSDLAAESARKLT